MRGEVSCVGWLDVVQLAGAQRRWDCRQCYGLGSSYNATGPARTSRIHYMLHVLDVLRLCANEEHAGRIVAHATTNPSDLDAATGLCAGHFTTGRLARTCFLRTERGGVRQIVNSCEMAGTRGTSTGGPMG